MQSLNRPYIYRDMEVQYVYINAFLAEAEATCIQILHYLRPSLYLVIEQPSGSWAFKQPELQSLTDLMGLQPGHS